MFSVLNNFFTLQNWRRIILSFLVIIFFCLLFYGFPDSPAPWFDEGIHLSVAKTLATKGVYSFAVGAGDFLEERYLVTTGYPLLGVVALVFKLFGVGIYQAKLVMFAFLTIFVYLFYKLSKKYYGTNNALCSLALLVVFLPFYGNGKSVLGEIPGLVYFLGGLLLLDKKKWWQLFLAGLLFGLGSATKPIYLLFLFALLGGELWLVLKNKKIYPERWVWLALGGFIPLFFWIYTLLPHAFDSSSLLKIFNFYRNPYAVTVEGVFLTNVWRFFSESTPIHFTLLFGVFVLSKIISKKFNQIEVVLSVFICLILFSYLRVVGWYRYFFPAHVLLFILFPFALSTVCNKFTNNVFKKYATLSIIVVLFFIQSLHLFLNINKKLYYDQMPRKFIEAANHLVPNNASVLVFDNPSVATGIINDNMTQYLTIKPFLLGKSPNEIFLPEYIIISEDDLATESISAKYLNILQKGDVILLKKK